MWKSTVTIVAAVLVSWQQMQLVESFSTCLPEIRNRGDRMTANTMTISTLLTSHDDSKVEMGRFRFLECGVLTTAALFAAPMESVGLSSYSSNARNMERLSSGDSSGGSTYDNYPKTEASKKRRAMTGCKIPAARQVAAQMIEQDVLNEKDCNMRVMGGETEFMLETIRKLDCPTCPYGIDPK
jgi:hypothetical protein